MKVSCSRVGRESIEINVFVEEFVGGYFGFFFVLEGFFIVVFGGDVDIV